jgi:hypothetical protein
LVGAGLRCVGVASHETLERLATAGAAHVVQDFEAVTPHDLECVLLRPDRDPVAHQAAATARG